MTTDQRPASPPPMRSGRRWLALAGVLQGIAMLLLMASLVRLTPLTMTFSVGGGGLLLALACGIYLLNVILELRSRRLL